MYCMGGDTGKPLEADSAGCWGSCQQRVFLGLFQVPVPPFYAAVHMALCVHMLSEILTHDEMASQQLQAGMGVSERG